MSELNKAERSGPNPAEMYEDFLVPGIHARWTPVFLKYANPVPGERVLDVACGTGIVTRSLATAVGPDGRVVGLDVSPEMLTVARDRVPEEGSEVEWRQGDAQALPFSDDEFDLALCQQGLQFFDDPALAVEEMRRVIKPGGRTALSVWQGLNQHPLYAELSRAEARYLGTSVEALATPFLMGDVDRLAELLEGFTRVEITQETLEVRFPSPPRFVALTLLAAASIIPGSELDDEARKEMVATISREIEPVLDEFIEGDSVAFPMHAHVAVAYA